MTDRKYGVEDFVQMTRDNRERHAYHQLVDYDEAFFMNKIKSATFSAREKTCDGMSECKLTTIVVVVAINCVMCWFCVVYTGILCIVCHSCVLCYVIVCCVSSRGGSCGIRKEVNACGTSPLEKENRTCNEDGKNIIACDPFKHLAAM